MNADKNREIGKSGHRDIGTTENPKQSHRRGRRCHMFFVGYTIKTSQARVPVPQLQEKTHDEAGD
jgi:hypothetical protein